MVLFKKQEKVDDGIWKENRKDAEWEIHLVLLIIP